MASAPPETLGKEAAAVATLITAVGGNQTFLSSTEIVLPGRIDFATLYQVLVTQTIVGRLNIEDPAVPSAIVLNRKAGAEGSSIVQVAFPDRALSLRFGLAARDVGEAYEKHGDAIAREHCWERALDLAYAGAFVPTFIPEYVPPPDPPE